MKIVDFYVFLSAFTYSVAVAALAEYLRYRERRFLATVLVTLVIIPLNAWVGNFVDPEMKLDGLIRFLLRERDASTLAAVAMGYGAAMLWFVRYFRRPRLSEPEPRSWLEVGWMIVSLLLVFGCSQAFLWKEIWGVTRHAVFVHDPRFTIEKVADLDEEPLRMAVDGEGAVYLCHDYFKKHGLMGGAVLRLAEDPATGRFQTRIVAEAPFLIRPYGIQVRDGDIYVSRSGFFPRATLGTLTYAATGAITQLKDIDGDGYFEYADDVITDLPGIRAPDTMQQNNGIEFDREGNLYVTCAGASDRTPDEHPWGGTILRYNNEFKDPIVFARGFRNPWEVAVGPDGGVFATDNDVDSNPGDEINHIIEGEHYGHPYVVSNEKNVKAIGFRDPLVVGEREAVFLGIAFASPNSNPAPLRGSMYVTDFRQNRVMRLELETSGDTFKVKKMERFASIPTPVDIAATESGDIYVISRRAKKLFRIRPKERLTAASPQ
jgi:glucose/arabinose dehydrogenase